MFATFIDAFGKKWVVLEVIEYDGEGVECYATCGEREDWWSVNTDQIIVIN